MEGTKNVLHDSENLESTRKETTLWSRYCWYLAASISIVAVVFSGTELHALDRFGETFTSKLCEILPSPPQKEVIAKQEEQHEDEEEFNDAVVSFGGERIHNATHSKLSHVYIAGGRAYQAMQAMESRYNLMRDVCNRYADKMRGESILHESKPKAHSNFLFYPVKNFAFCQSPGVATKSVKIFFYSGEMGKAGQSSQETFTVQFPFIMNRVNTAVVVRHPLERLVSIYRSTFEAHVDVDNVKNQKMEQKYTFPEFVEIVLYGYAELSEFFEQNNLDMTTPTDQMDTGMVDGDKEPSIKWNSYWRHCGVCHKDFQPKYILHLEHLKQDLRAVYEDWMEPKYWTDNEKRVMERFLNLKSWNIISSKPEILQHYYSQLTKSKIQALYGKYRADHELFGYTPDYFIALGKEE